MMYEEIARELGSVERSGSLEIDGDWGLKRPTKKSHRLCVGGKLCMGGESEAVLEALSGVPVFLSNCCLRSWVLDAFLER